MQKIPHQGESTIEGMVFVLEENAEDNVLDEADYYHRSDEEQYGVNSTAENSRLPVRASPQEV